MSNSFANFLAGKGSGHAAGHAAKALAPADKLPPTAPNKMFNAAPPNVVFLPNATPHATPDAPSDAKAAAAVAKETAPPRNAI